METLGTNQTLIAARAYVGRGWPVIPLKKDTHDGKTVKRPLIEAWQQLGIVDDGQLVEWFGDGSGYGIGIVASNEHAIVDIDLKHGGIESFVEATGLMPEAFPTPTARTATGGYHLHFKNTDPDRVLANWVGFLPGIDLRVDGGQVVAPPTVRQDADWEAARAYVWLKTAGQIEMAELPEWVRPKQKDGKKEDLRQKATIEPGTWNDTMIRHAGVEVRRSASEDELYERLVVISNTRSRPEDRELTALDHETLRGMAHRAWEQFKTEQRYEQSEEGQSQLFAQTHRDVARFNWSTGDWMVWAEHWWELDRGGRVRDWVGNAYEIRLADARQAYNDFAKQAPDGLSIKEVEKWVAEHDRAGLGAELSFAKSMGSYRAQEAVWHLARKHLGSARIDWDTDPTRIGVKNGVVNLVTGELEKGIPEQMLSRHVDIEYQPAVTCPRWERFVSEILSDDSEMVEYFHRLIGYGLTGDNSLQQWWLLKGSGSNGKGLLRRTLRNIFADYGHTMAIEALTKTRNRTGISNDVVELDGKRLVVAGEPENWAEIDTSRIKSLSHGDTVRARNLNEKNKEFVPVCKFVIDSNHDFTVKDDTDGFWRSMRRIILKRGFWPSKDDSRWKDGDMLIDPDLEVTLRVEYEGILAWIVRGAMKFYADRLTPDPLRTPRKVIEDTEAERRAQDTFGQFLNSVMEDGDGTVKIVDLYTLFRQAEMEKHTPEFKIMKYDSFRRLVRDRYGDERVNSQNHEKTLVVLGKKLLWAMAPLM